MDRLPQRYALYLRVSSEDQAERGTIETQRGFLAGFASLHKCDVYDTYVDDGVSGTIPLQDRPAGHRLLHDANAGHFTCVLAYRVDRLGRSLSALLHAHDLLTSAGVSIKSATEPFDTSDAIGRFIFQLLGSFAELEKSTISERTTLGRDRAVRSGRWTDGPVPFGYDLDTDGHLIISARMVEISGMTEADVARDIFTRIANGSTANAEVQRLNAFHVPTTRRYSGKAVDVARQWVPTRLHYMLRNSVYMGVHVYRSKHGRLEREVPALVDADTWHRVQEQLRRNRTLPKGNATRLYLLRGLIRCATCGQTFIGTPGATTKKSGRLFYYRCAGAKAALQPDPQQRCRAKALRADWLEDLVWQDCRTFILNPGEALAAVERQLQDRTSQRDDIHGERQRLQRALADQDKAREDILTLLRRGRITLQEADAQLDAVQRDSGVLKAHLDALDAQQALTEATALLGQLRERLAAIEHGNDVLTKQQVMALLVNKIDVETTPGHPKQARLRIDYVFTPSHRAEFSTAPPVLVDHQGLDIAILAGDDSDRIDANAYGLLAVSGLTGVLVA